MQQFVMHLCDSCGFSQTVAGQCPYCETVLTMYSKEGQAEYQLHAQAEEAMRRQDPLRWYL